MGSFGPLPPLPGPPAGQLSEVIDQPSRQPRAISPLPQGPGPRPRGAPISVLVWPDTSVISRRVVRPFFPLNVSLRGLPSAAPGNSLYLCLSSPDSPSLPSDSFSDALEHWLRVLLSHTYQCGSFPPAPSSFLPWLSEEVSSNFTLLRRVL